MDNQFDRFIHQLAQARPPDRVFNHYTYGYQANAVRRHNLGLYLQQMDDRQPRTILVAEAPGYRGCRLTGVPFVSPDIARHGLDDVDLFGETRGYRVTNEWPKVQREASATIMWQTLRAYSVVPLLWNAFPFHPHRSGSPQSNRTPNTKELQMGEPFLRALLQLFPVSQIVAVGNRAETALTKWDIPFYKVRHPAQGGKKEFMSGMKRLL
jgi:uracil-DNA glycosylase